MARWSGRYSFVEQVEGATGAAATRRYSLVVVGRPTCASASPASGDVGSFVVVRTCSAYFAHGESYLPDHFAVSSGSLPPGLLLQRGATSSAWLHGTPTTTGTFAFTITATDELGGSASGTYSVTIYPPLALTGGGLPVSPAGHAVHSDRVPLHLRRSRPVIEQVAPSDGTAPRQQKGPALAAVVPVTITGRNFLGATAVTFAGVHAEFEVVSATEIAAVLPAGDTPGALSVVTPEGRAHPRCSGHPATVPTLCPK